jgi:hypothetical protein
MSSQCGGGKREPAGGLELVSVAASRRGWGAKKEGDSG